MYRSSATLIQRLVFFSFPENASFVNGPLGRCKRSVLAARQGESPTRPWDVLRYSDPPLSKTSSRVQGVVSSPVTSCPVLSRPGVCPPVPEKKHQPRMTFVTPIFGLLIWRRKGPRGSGRSQKDGCHLGVVGSVWPWLLFGQFLLGRSCPANGGREGGGGGRVRNGHGMCTCLSETTIVDNQHQALRGWMSVSPVIPSVTQCRYCWTRLCCCHFSLCTLGLKRRCNGAV